MPILFGTVVAGQLDCRFAWLGVAHALSPDVHFGPPGLRSLRVRCAPASMPALASPARSRARATPPVTAVHKPSTAQQRTPQVEETVAALARITSVF
jgi:hypothetical protein